MAHRLCRILLNCTKRGILRTKPKLPCILQARLWRYHCSCSVPEPKHKIGYTPYIRPCEHISHDEKNMFLGRPMSPHLTIYGPTLPAMTSIAQRATGITLSLLSFIVAAAELFYPGGTCCFIRRIHKLGIPESAAIALKSILAATFLHHYLNGIRFVFFNLAQGLGLKTAYKTARTAIALTIVCSILTALIGHYGIGWKYPDRRKRSARRN